MPRTPYRFHGNTFYVPGTETPAEDGEIAYIQGLGFRFYDNGVIRNLTQSNSIVVVGTYADNYTTTWMVIGVTTVTWDNQMAWAFRAHLAAPAGFTAEVQLYDETNHVVVTNSVLSTTNTTPTPLTSPALTLGTGTVTYYVQLRIASGSPTSNNRASCYSAELVFN